MQAHAAGRIGIHQRHPQPVMRRANGGHISTGASADDGEVIIQIIHARNLATKRPEANKECIEGGGNGEQEGGWGRGRWGEGEGGGGEGGGREDFGPIFVRQLYFCDQ